MPVISTYGEPRQSIEVAQGPQASTLPMSNFSGAATALKTIADTAQVIQQRVGQAQAEETLLDFEKAKNTVLFDPKDGYFNTQGKDAYNGSKSTMDTLQKIAQDHAATIKDPAARDAFMKVAQNHLLSAQQSIAQHASQGLNAWELANSKAQVENTLQNAMLYRGDDRKLAIQRELGKQAVIDTAHREGLDGDALNQRLKDYNSTFASATISASIKDGSEAGIAALNAHGDNLTEPDRIKLEDELKKKQKEEETTTLATIGLTAGRNIADQYYDQGIQAARDAIDAQFKDPKQNDAVTKQMIAQFRIKDYAKQRDQVQAFDGVENYLLSSTPDSPRTVESLKAERPDLWSTLTPKQQVHFESGAATITNQQTLLDIKSKTMDQLATLNVSDYADKLSSSDRKAVMKMVEDARAGKHDIQIQSDAQLVNETVKRYGLNDEQKQSVIEQVTHELNAAVNAKGEPLSPKDRKNIINNSIGQFVIENSWYRMNTEYDIKNTPVPELRAMNLVEKQLTSAIPDAADQNKIRRNIAAIRDVLNEAGTPVTRDSILAEYLKQFPIRRTPATVRNPNVSTGKIKYAE